MNTMNVDGTELAVEFEPKDLNGRVHLYTITVRHPEGGIAVYEVQNYRGWTAYEAAGSDSPVNIHQAVLALVKRMDASWGGGCYAAPRFIFEAALAAS